MVAFDREHSAHHSPHKEFLAEITLEVYLYVIQLLHALRAFMKSLFSRLSSAEQPLHSLAPLPSVVPHTTLRNAMVNNENRLLISTNEHVYASCDLATKMPSLHPTFDKPSGPALGGGPAGWNTISSPDGRLNITPMSAEYVQEKRYEPRTM